MRGQKRRGDLNGRIAREDKQMKRQDEKYVRPSARTGKTRSVGRTVYKGLSHVRQILTKRINVRAIGRPFRREPGGSKWGPEPYSVLDHGHIVRT